MSTVDDAKLAGEVAMRDLVTEADGIALWSDLSGAAARAMWPILSAPIREMHWQLGHPGICHGCGHEWPCPTMIRIHETDKGLGCE